MSRLRIISLAFSLMIMGLLVEVFRQQPAEARPAPDLETLVPSAFGDWQASPLTSVIAPLEQVEETGTATLYRTYENTNGDLVTLVIAYGSAMGDSVRLHNPAVCYRAQGFDVKSEAEVAFDVAGSSIPLRRMSGDKPPRVEQVAYWLRVGDRFANGQAAQQVGNLLSGRLKGADSTLVRVSVASKNPEYAKPLQEDFLTEFLTALPEITKNLVIPSEAL